VKTEVERAKRKGNKSVKKINQTTAVSKTLRVEARSCMDRKAVTGTKDSYRENRNGKQERGDLNKALKDHVGKRT